MELARSNTRVPTLSLPAEVSAYVCKHAAAIYPEEACGILFGSDAGHVRRITRAERVCNDVPGPDRARRFAIPADVLRRAELSAGAERVVGFYHSHPDHPSVPSATDLEHAWDFYSYLIVQVVGGAPGELRCWTLADADDRRFVQQQVCLPPDCFPARN